MGLYSVGDYGDYFLKAQGAASMKICPECEELYAMKYIGEDILVCKYCGYSIESDDYAAELQERMEIEGGYYDMPTE